jgi:hypothetical protein
VHICINRLCFRLYNRLYNWLGNRLYNRLYSRLARGAGGTLSRRSCLLRPGC